MIAFARFTAAESRICRTFNEPPIDFHSLFSCREHYLYIWRISLRRFAEKSLLNYSDNVIISPFPHAICALRVRSDRCDEKSLSASTRLRTVANLDTRRNDSAGRPIIRNHSLASPAAKVIMHWPWIRREDLVPSRKGFARIIRGRGRERSALILGQRPTSPKGVQCYVSPLAHCGSYCCANYITTGSGRDLPSVARNSVSRGLASGVAQCNSNSARYAGNADVRRRPPRARATRRWDVVTFVALRDVIRRINAEVPYVHTTPAGYVPPFETCLSARVRAGGN